MRFHNFANRIRAQPNKIGTTIRELVTTDIAEYILSRNAIETYELRWFQAMGLNPSNITRRILRLNILSNVSPKIGIVTGSVLAAKH